MKTLFITILLFWQNMAFGYNSQDVARCLQGLRGVLPGAQNHSLSDSRQLFLFNETSYGGKVGDVSEGGLVIDAEGIRICGFDWQSYNNEVYGFRILGTRYRYQTQPPELRSLGTFEGRLLNMQQPACNMDNVGTADSYLHNLVLKTLALNENNPAVSADQKSNCMRSLGIAESEFAAARRNTPPANGRPATNGETAP